jgi:hypothetical protein
MNKIVRVAWMISFIVFASAASAKSAVTSEGAPYTSDGPCETVDDVETLPGMVPTKLTEPQIIDGLSYNRSIKNTVGDALFFNFAIDEKGVGLYDRMFIVWTKEHFVFDVRFLLSWDAHTSADHPEFGRGIDMSFIARDGKLAGFTTNAIRINIINPAVGYPDVLNNRHVYVNPEIIKCYTEK